MAVDVERTHGLLAPPTPRRRARPQPATTATQGRHRPWEAQWSMLRATVDVMALLLVAATAASARALVPVGADPRNAALEASFVDVVWVVPVWSGLLAARGAYSRKRVDSTSEQQRVLVSASVVACGLSGTVLYVVDATFYRSVFVLLFALGFVVLAAVRVLLGEILAGLRRRGWAERRAVLWGNTRDLDETLTAFTRAPRLGFRFVGTIGGSAGATRPEVTQLGEVHDVRHLCQDHRVDTVVVAGADRGSADVRRLMWDLQGTGVDVVVLPSLLDVAGPRVRMLADSGLPRVHLAEPQFDRANRVVKRAFDVVVGGALLLMCAPVMALVACLVRLEDGRAAFFRQCRVGRGGEEFVCLKFRTMHEGAERLEAGLRSDHEGAHWKLRRDPRVTRVGRWLRSWSVDELPQLVNVVRGEMSLVGPRPQQHYEVATYSEPQTRRLLVRPGMTGLWQVSGRSDVSLDEAVRLDLYYVENWSLAMDVVILARTLRAVVSRAGAY